MCKKNEMIKPEIIKSKPQSSEQNKMSSQLNSLIRTLPQDIGKEIFKFLIPDENNVEFRLDDYNKHPIAFINNKILFNKKLHLFLIKRKNGKTRYYISEKKISYYFCVECGSDGYCSCPYEYKTGPVVFKSKYVGSDLNKALFELTFHHAISEPKMDYFCLCDSISNLGFL